MWRCAGKGGWRLSHVGANPNLCFPARELSSLAAELSCSAAALASSAAALCFPGADPCGFYHVMTLAIGGLNWPRRLFK